MVQAIDVNSKFPQYTAVKIDIKKPEINTNGTDKLNNNGNFNAVDIKIDNPTINQGVKKIYDYPQAKEPITFDKANIMPMLNPAGLNITSQTTNVLLAPKAKQPQKAIKIDVPEPNYTTTEAEKGITQPEKLKEENGISFKAAEPQKIEIIPSEDIRPDVNIALVLSNLSDSNYDTQAQQMEEIARLSFDNPQNVRPYIVRDVFTNLINITEKDSSKLAGPTQEQIQARRKIITNYIITENAKRNNIEKPELPFEITNKDREIANELSPMELAERNKEYALYTISILAKIYTDEIEEHTGDIVPLTDLPGSAAIVDALRYSQNSGVKIAAIDALRHIQRPEYKDELSVLYNLAQADRNPQVARTATNALQSLNNNQQ